MAYKPHGEHYWVNRKLRKFDLAIFNMIYYNLDHYYFEEWGFIITCYNV